MKTKIYFKIYIFQIDIRILSIHACQLSLFFTKTKKERFYHVSLFLQQQKKICLDSDVYEIPECFFPSYLSLSLFKKMSENVYSLRSEFKKSEFRVNLE